VLKQEGVPQDLIYLAEAESGFHPLALSNKGARGMWQFMASRAAGYGLERNWWVDDRQDPEKSTRAAARHLKDLYKEFGDWYLAMAAYNSGPLTVQQAVQRTGYADFWELYRRNVLPAQTRNYVPIILAVAIMAKNPSQYGLDHIVPDQPMPSDTVSIDYPVDLRLVAECVDTSVTTLQDLNPSLLRMTTPRTGTFDLHLPAGTTETYQTAIAAIPRDMRVWWRYHKVGEGETLAGIARTYRTTSAAIAQANNLDKAGLEAGSKLIIPVAPGHYVDGITYAKRATRYRVRRGDTVTGVAESFGVPSEKLRQWNRIRGNRLRAGSVLYIHRPVTPGEERVASVRRSKYKRTSHLRASTGTAKVLHKVRRGETLTSIASRYNTSVAALRRDNGRVAASLRAGDVLVIRETR
jgi:membrane-bound lytic murein transglycosylase D